MLQHLVASVADKQRKCPKFSGESKYDDFDHWFRNIFRFYVSLDRYEERGKPLELRSALKEGSPAQRAFDFLELLSHGSFVQATMSIRTFPHKSPAERDIECRHQFRVGLGDDWAYKLLNCPDSANFHQTLRWVLERAAKQESIRAIKGSLSSRNHEWQGMKRQSNPNLVPTKKRVDLPIGQRNTTSRFVPKTTERTLSPIKRCWKYNEMGHTQHTHPRKNATSTERLNLVIPENQ